MSVTAIPPADIPATHILGAPDDNATEEVAVELTHPGIRADSLAASVMLLLVMTIVQRLAGLTREMLFCKWLTDSQIGSWNLAYGFLMLAAPVAVLGLPGSFGRYAEHFRQQGQLRTFLRRVGFSTLLLAFVAVGLVLGQRTWFARQIFGDVNLTFYVAVLAPVLVATIAFNTLASLFTSLRMYRVASSMQFSNSVLFALFGVVLVTTWRMDAASVIVAYGLAATATALGSTVYLRRAWHTLPEPVETPPHSTFWGKLVPFAFGIWITNWLTNLFEVADRYLIIHRSGLTEAKALALVGQYHSSRIIPLLLMGVSDLLASLVLPHLTHDWELGNRAAVSHRMNLIVKALGLGLTSASVGTVLVAPLLFDKIFHGKFAAGKEVLPLVLAYCAWWGLSGLANTYLWCTEKVRVGTISIFVGLIATVVLNLVLLPTYGLQGAATASLIARLLTLVVMYSFARANGMRWDRGALLATAAPALVLLGPWFGLAGLLALFVLAAFSHAILNADEKHELAAVWQSNTSRLRAMFGT